LAFLLKIAAEFTKVIRYCERETKYIFTSDMKDKITTYINDIERHVAERDRKMNILKPDDKALVPGFFRSIKDYLGFINYY
jgi:hypothetical protein